MLVVGACSTKPQGVGPILETGDPYICMMLESNMPSSARAATDLESLRSHRFDPLSCAVSGGAVEALEIMMDRGADPLERIDASAPAYFELHELEPSTGRDRYGNPISTPSPEYKERLLATLEFFSTRGITPCSRRGDDESFIEWLESKNKWRLVRELENMGYVCNE